MFEKIDSINQRLEHKAWLHAFEKIAETMGVSKDELNDKKYKKMFSAIEDWGQEYARMRIVQRDNGIFDVMVKDGKMF